METIRLTCMFLVESGIWKRSKKASTSSPGFSNMAAVGSSISWGRDKLHDTTLTLFRFFSVIYPLSSVELCGTALTNSLNARCCRNVSSCLQPCLGVQLATGRGWSNIHVTPVGYTHILKFVYVYIYIMKLILQNYTDMVI